MNRAICSLIAAVSLTEICVANELRFDPPPKNGLVPDAKTAIAIAVAVWKARYGDALLHHQRYEAELRGDVWWVSTYLPKGALGGGVIAKISKKDGTVLGTTVTM